MFKKFMVVLALAFACAAFGEAPVYINLDFIGVDAQDAKLTGNIPAGIKDVRKNVNKNDKKPSVTRKLRLDMTQAKRAEFQVKMVGDGDLRVSLESYRWVNAKKKVAAYPVKCTEFEINGSKGFRRLPATVSTWAAMNEPLAVFDGDTVTIKIAFEEVGDAVEK